MAVSKNLLFAKKINAIFENDVTSPLFVRKANEEINKNNLKTAVDILSAGLKNHPDHPVAYILISKALAMSGNFAQAEEALNRGCAIINSQQTREFYLKEIEKIKEKMPAREVDRLLTMDDYEAKTSGKKSKKKKEKDSGRTIDEQLVELAEKISNTPAGTGTGESADIERKKQRETALASETLAEIYVSQGEISEAIKTYKILQQKYPDKRLSYEKKIEDLKNKKEE